MPKPRGIQTLHRSCLINIADNISYWTEHYEKHVLKRSPQERRKILFLLGPFDELNSLVANELIELLLLRKKLTYPALRLIINSGSVTRLNLEGAAKFVNDSVISSITKQCPNLKFLNLSKCKRITASAFLNLSTRLKNALSLDFSFTAINIHSLCNIVQTSTNLLELVLKDCKVNDEALQSLERTVGGCGPLKMRSLDLSDNDGITETGLRLLLAFMPNLEEVKHHLLFEAISESEAILPSTVRNDNFLLRSLSCLEADLVNERDLENIVERCPHLNRLEIRLTSELTIIGLLRLSCLESLRELVLDGNDHVGNFAPYRLKVKPLLEACGGTLVSLVIENVKGLDLVEVLHLCPNLRNLTILQHGQPANFRDGAHVAAGFTSKLMRLCVWSRIRDTTLTERALESVLSSAVDLECLEFFQVDGMTGSVLGRVSAVHPMTKLSWLHLQECNHITGKDLSLLLMDENNSLTKVTLINNWQVNRADFDSWKRRAGESNLDLQILWE